jgi:hypothetical protein
VDGVKNGHWGFHTGYQENPWWQVDLGSVTSLDRIVIWNRCDAFADRSSRLKVLTSSDGKEFSAAHERDGAPFLGFSDAKPHAASLEGRAVRFVRITLPGTTYLHLDEVEIYAAGKPDNLALGKPATQSSVSEWSARHSERTPERPLFDVARVVTRGLKLADRLAELGVPTGTYADKLRKIGSEAEKAIAESPTNDVRPHFLRAHWLNRELAFKNPRLNFNDLLFVQRAPPAFPHMSDQHYGWWSRAGGGLMVMKNFRSNGPEVRRLTAIFPEGSFAGPDVSYDGKKILFAYARFYHGLFDEKNKADKSRVPEDAFYHIFEMNADGSEVFQLTHGRYDDFDPRYLPNGDIVFVSTRKGQALQVSKAYSEKTRFADLPDSYVRCGGDNWRPVPVFTLHVMDAEGKNFRPLSAFENFEWTPSVGNDGRLLYTRWDYIDRFNGHFFSLWSANQDGTNPQLVYGNYTVKPQVVIEARAIPDSSKLVFTASAHHSNVGGSICLLDREQGLEDLAPLTRVTPEVCFPETEGSPDHYYANPWPLSEDFFLVGWADAKLPPHRFVTDDSNPTNAMGIYLLDVFGNQELIYRDRELSSMHPMPLASRRRPPVQTTLARWEGSQEGAFLIQDVYAGLGETARGSINKLRVVAVPPKVQPHMNQPNLGVSSEDPGKYVLGEAPVERDGSAYFRVPSGVPVFFQALGTNGLAVQTMRTLTYVMPGQTLSCIGCHEGRDTAPSSAGLPLAGRRAPTALAPGPEGSWPLDFARLVQPVLDQNCVRCHSPSGEDAKAKGLELTAENSFKSLLSFGQEDLKKQAFERDRSVPGQAPAGKSRLWQMLTAPEGHNGVRIERAALERIAVWMDTYAQRQGHFSEEQERELARFREMLTMKPQ